ncbi:hypothetical protein NSK_002390 [Nannochloropsis salina CCMP1776]|uniref:SAYSvFN domain-containing protein n=1 Tax=Nannochloropsis salina CCMP1776 TaxID=1027361 RepID=A0A4D9D3R7_9STRA|nr:hypothetical protein NSK_002390 [Nannochloropsis salina CCMP1776]|eukprot:TFJ86182.1 hypothetical protein NSK_002390 [Nannochloropsis salina CCMP1776]
MSLARQDSRSSGTRTPSTRRSRWYAFACAVAYELRPFTPPTAHDLLHYIRSSRQVGRDMCEEALQFSKNTAWPLLCRVLGILLSWRYAIPLTAFAAAFYVAVTAEFGLVFLILSSLVLIWTVGLGDDATTNNQAGERLSPWSVFNRGMTTMMGTINPEQFDAELRHYRVEGENSHGVEERRPEMGAQEPGGGDGAGREGEVREGADGGAGRPGEGGRSRKSGKKARRRFDRDKRRGQGRGGGGEDDWEEDWVSDDDRE